MTNQPTRGTNRLEQALCTGAATDSKLPHNHPYTNVQLIESNLITNLNKPFVQWQRTAINTLSTPVHEKENSCTTTLVHTSSVFVQAFDPFPFSLVLSIPLLNDKHDDSKQTIAAKQTLPCSLVASIVVFVVLYSGAIVLTGRSYPLFVLLCCWPGRHVGSPLFFFLIVILLYSPFDHKPTKERGG